MPRKTPKRMTEAALEAACLSYLARFATSSANLKRVLARKVEVSATHHGDDPAPLLTAVDRLVARFLKSGAIDDARYAETQAAKLRRRGGSARSVTGKLSAKGVTKDVIADTLDGGEPGAERIAAAAFARRRRLGPFRTGERTEHRMKDLAALGRAGFDYRTAALVIDATDQEALMATLCDT